jgi:hypothetical protein
MTNRSLLAGFQVLTAVVVKIHIFWDITPYNFPYELLHARSLLGLFFEPVSSETSVDFQRTARRYIPEDTTLKWL